MPLLRHLTILLALLKCFCEGQELRKNARIIDATANPDIVEISFSIGLPINVPGANLTETISPFLDVGEYQTQGLSVQRSEIIENSVTFTFNTTLDRDQVILAYNVTLVNNGVGFSEIVNLTSTLTYFTGADRTSTNSSTVSVCLGKRTEVTIQSSNQNWYIAIVVILAFILGAIVFYAVAKSLFGQETQSSKDTGLAKGKTTDKESAAANSSISSNHTDLSHVITSDDTVRSSQLLELCEIRDLSNAEYRLQDEKAHVLWALLTTAAAEKVNSKTRKQYEESVKMDIKKAVDEVHMTNQESLQKERDKIETRNSTLRRKQEVEIEKLQGEAVAFEPETQQELKVLVEEKQAIEIRHEEHIGVLRLQGAERRGGNPSEATCNVLSEKFLQLTAEQDKEIHFARKKAFMLSADKVGKILSEQCVRIQAMTSWRRVEVNKIRNYELKVRGSWNGVAKVLIESVKTICRELELGANVRKDINSYIKEEMIKMKELFDREMAREKSEFLKKCAEEKLKYLKNKGESPSTKNANENPIAWVEDSFARIKRNMDTMLSNQNEYDAFVLNLWNDRFQSVLHTTSEMMKAMKSSVIEKLARQGASRRSVQEFIAGETKDDAIEKPPNVVPLETNEFSDENDDSKAKNILLRRQDEILRTFYDSQPFPVDRTGLKPEVELKSSQPKEIRLSLQRIRELIEFHVNDVGKRNKSPKKKINKGRIRMTEQVVRGQYEKELHKWKDETLEPNSKIPQLSSSNDMQNELLIMEENLSNVISSQLMIQWSKKSKLDLLQLDLNALEKLMMVLLHLLLTERKISPAECNTVIQEHRTQSAEIQKASSLRTRRRLGQVVRKRLHSPPPKPLQMENGPKDKASSQVLHHLNANKNVAKSATRKIREDSEAEKEKFEILTHFTEQQAIELRDFDLRAIQGLAKVAKVPSGEMNACFSLLLHHRTQDEIEQMMRVVYIGENDEGKEKTDLLPTVRELISQQKHRLAENVLRTDDDFAPTPLRSSNKLQRIKQPHHVTFIDDSPSLIRKVRQSRLPDILPNSTSRTTSPDQESVLSYDRQEGVVYNGLDKPVKSSRRRKKKSLKSLLAAR